MKKLITIKDLDLWGACKRGAGEAYSDENLKALLKGKRGWTPLEIAKMKKIPAGDRLWVLLRPEILSEKNLRLFAADCAEHVLHFFEDKYPNDDRPRKAILAARDYANGEIDAVAWAAAAARDAAWAGAAEGDAAGEEAWAAERAWQIKRLRHYLKNVSK